MAPRRPRRAGSSPITPRRGFFGCHRHPGWPSIVVRPGRLNKARPVSSRLSSREPLAGGGSGVAGRESVLHWHGQPAAAAGSDFSFMPPASTGGQLGPRVILTNARRVRTVAEQIAALRRIAGRTKVCCPRREPDPAGGADPSPAGRVGFDPRRATGARAFRRRPAFDEIIHGHIADELGGKIAS